MPKFKADELGALGRACFMRVGMPENEAELVADHLVESGLLGHDTHSVLRLPQYVNMVRDGVVERRCRAPGRRGRSVDLVAVSVRRVLEARGNDELDVKLAGDLH